MAKQYVERTHDTKAIDHILDNERCALFEDMGMGKTAQVLTACKELLKERSVKKILIIAPLLVAKYVWNDECEAWQHLNDINIIRILGNPAQRKEAMRTPGQIYIINVSNIGWLKTQWGLKHL